MSFSYLKELPTPEEIKKSYPLTEECKKIKQDRDEEISRVLRGESDKFLVIIGPCSADKEEPVMDYIHRLAKVNEQTKDKLILIPRIYTNKPRTTGEGYKGIATQPDPEAKPDMIAGLIAVRNLHLRAIKETGLSAADEMLYPENHKYLSDLLSYVAVGARSVENQQHRLTASGLDIPVGMKNPTGGSLSVMMNALQAAQSPHTFIYRNWEVESRGNTLAHAILRGYVDSHGITHPNYHYEDLATLCDLYAASGLVNPAVVVDTNHSNSGKQYLEQIRIAKEVLHSTRHNEDIFRLVKGLMIESYIEDGAQKPSTP